MVMVALIMRPWIVLMRMIPGISCYILADDVLILAEGTTMVGRLAHALNTTHELLDDMGAKVAPSKSFNFASDKEAATWLEQTTWDHIDTKIDVVTDFRYLGAHLTSRQNPTSSTLDARWDKALTQLKRLRYAPASVEAKASIILAKTYVAALYGIEVARLQPVKIARLTAAVIDVYRSRNNNHNVDRFFATLGEEARDLDPVVQIYGRRALQIRRTCCKNKDAEQRFKDTLLKYAARHKKGDEWPKWYYDIEQDITKHPNTYPTEQPYPTTKDFDNDWDLEIDPMGPVGLLIESVIWNGLVIDKNFTIWQRGEEPVSVLSMPYQNLKSQLHMQASRARALAEWGITTSTRMAGLREIDRQASQIDPKLDDEEKGVVRTIQMGGNMGKQQIAAFNQDIDGECNYCREAPSTGPHIRWTCKYFEPLRQRTDKDLAQIPRHYLLECVRCGVAPAMKMEGELTYWGMNVAEHETQNTKELL